MLIKWTISNCTTTCADPIAIDQSVITTYSELFVPARTLDYGIYELKLTVTMMASSTMTSSASAYVQITRSGITANLVHFGTSIITSGHQKDLILDPGTYSIDPDEESFNASVSDETLLFSENILTLGRIGTMSITADHTISIVPSLLSPYNPSINPIIHVSQIGQV